MDDRRARSNHIAYTSASRRPARARRLRRGLRAAGNLLFLLLLLALPPLRAQDLDPEDQVEALLATMTVEERVGQLFLVSFVGSDAGPSSDVARLIQEERVGGVVLLASNSNFSNDPTAPRQVAELANQLQAAAMATSAGVPIFVAVDHEGDGYPYTRIRGGTTDLPNAMSIGATWAADNARAVGQIVGLELAAMGVNLLLGPGMDVLADARPDGQGDIGTRAFGGDPWWVGHMGRAYIEGVHGGSGGRVATVAKHFPGHGGSDRLPDAEVATVDKSIEELAQVELAPFMAITGAGGEPAAITDALMSSHIRYRGVQRNVRQFTAPISFDAEGMEAILALEPFATWRPTGLIVSDSLGVPAVRRYFDPTLATFPHRRIAKEAFLAGNDILLLAQFALEDDWSRQLANIRDVVAFFRDEYRRDPAFATRVDTAVGRILRAKLALYPEFALEAVQVHPATAVEVCGLGGEVTQEIASESLTLLYPDANALPAAPRQGEEIVIFTDARPVRECFTAACEPFSPLSRGAVEEAILRSYGPAGTGQIDPGDVTSLPFGQLKTFLQGGAVETDVEALLADADWVILVQQDLDPVKGPNSDAAKLYLNSPWSVVSDARIVVLALNAPYYLDTTEISKLSLYLGAYAKGDAFVGAAVRALFGELMPRGAPPVDVEGINYDLARELAPDPDQVIPLVREAPVSAGPVPPLVDVTLLAGPVLDGNGHPVPDGTEVVLIAAYDDAPGSVGYLQPQVTVTAGGMARGTFILERPGDVAFRAESGDAERSQVVSFAVASPPSDTPTLAPQATGTPASTPAATSTDAPATPTATATPAATATAPAAAGAGDRPVDGGDLFLSAIVVGLVVAAGSQMLGQGGRRRSTVIRGLLLAVLCGTAAYLLYGLQLVRPETWGLLPEATWAGRLALAALVCAASLLPLGLVWRWDG